MISDGEEDSLCMDYKLFNGEAWQSKYNDYEVIGVRTLDTVQYNLGVINIVINSKLS